MLKTDAGTMLKTARERKGLSQFELANESGVSIWTISDLETGRAKNPTLRTLSRVSRPLGIDPTSLFEQEGAA